MVRSLVNFIVIVCALAVIDSDMKFSDYNHLGIGGFCNAHEIDDNAVEQMWIHYREELEENSDDAQYLDLCLPLASKGSYDATKSDSTWLARKTSQKVISDWPSEEKHILLDCFRQQNLPLFDLHNEDASETWLVNYQSLSGWSSVPRRSLRDKELRHQVLLPALVPRPTSPSPAPSPTSASSPGPASPTPAAVPPIHKKLWHWVLPPASVPRPDSSPSAEAVLPIFTSAPSRHAPANSLSLHLESSAQSAKQKPLSKSVLPLPIIHPPPIKPQNLPPTPKHPPPRLHNFGPNSSESNHEDKKYMIPAVAGSIGAAVTLVALLLACYVRKNNKVGQKLEQRDDGQFLNLSSSDISAGPKEMSQSNGNLSSLKTSSALNCPLVTPNIHSFSGTEIQASEATGKSASPLPPPPPKPPALGPTPPPNIGPPANPPKPLGPHHRRHSSVGVGSETATKFGSSKARLKPFFWDKVNASPNHTMVWHEIKSGSFQVNEEMMESLFGYNPSDQNKNEHRKDSSLFDSTPQFIQIIDARKAQNLAILLKALNVTTEEVCDALKEGNELPSEFVQTLLKMAPTEDEELKLQLFTGDISELGPADRFLKVLVNIPFAFRRMESLLFMSIFKEETSSIKQSFATLEVASEELRNSRLFLKLLEAVLKTGNRMNDGTYRGGAQAFKLDTLLKLSDVKGTDGKTTLLHFVVQEISRSEGLRAARRLKESLSISNVKIEDCVVDSTQESSEYYQSLGLQVVSGLSNELENVKKAAIIDRDNLTQSAAKLSHSLSKAKDFLGTNIKNLEEDSKFRETLSNFLEHTEEEVTRLLEEEKRITALVKSTGDYFHGKTGKDEGLCLFVIVRDFLLTLDQVCKEVGELMKPANTSRKGASPTSPSQESQKEPLHDIHLRLFPAIRAQQADDAFSSDDESSSP